MDLNFYLYKSIKYFTDFKECYNRKQFNAFFFGSSILGLLFLYVITDLNSFTQSYQNFMFELGKSAGQTPEMLQQNAEIMAAYQNLTDQLPNPIWVALFSLVLIPAIAKRTNDTFMRLEFIAPYVIVSAIDLIQAVLGSSINLWLYNTMQIYNFVFISLLCFIPTKKNEEIL